MPQAAAYDDDIPVLLQRARETRSATNAQVKLSSAALVNWVKKADVFSEALGGRLAIDLELAEVKLLKTTIRNEAEQWPKLRESLQHSIKSGRAAAANVQWLELKLAPVCAKAAEQARYGLSGTR